MRLFASIVASVCALASVGCGSRIWVTDEVRNQVGDQGLHDLQMYVSSDIVLQRVLKSEETGVTKNHTLRIDKGLKMEEVIIAASTPGVIVKADDKRIAVSFEDKIHGQEVFVTFERGKNGYKEGYFMYPDKVNDKGEMIVQYGDQIYVATADSRRSHLVVDQDKVKVQSYEARQVPGRRVAEEPRK